MKVSNRWRMATLLAGALLAGTIIGPPIVQAATASLIRIEGGGSSHLATVSNSGQLSVNTGLASTPTRQLQVADASPSSLVNVWSNPNCSAGGIYTVPAGKALIITALNFYNWTGSPGSHQLVMYAGPPAAPCSSSAHPLSAGVGTDNGDSMVNQVYPSGIVVPAGDAVGLNTFNDSGSAELYGYLVPASAVPQSALKNIIGHAIGGVGTSRR